MARKPTEAQKIAAAERRAVFKELCDKIGAMSDSERAEIAARMPVLKADGTPYSPGNTCLIVSQFAGTPTIVAGFQQWRKLGRKIISGPGSGLAIWVPTARKKSADGADDTADENRKPGFIMGYVFDISQTALINETADDTAPVYSVSPEVHELRAELAAERADVAAVAAQFAEPRLAAELGAPRAADLPAAEYAADMETGYQESVKREAYYQELAAADGPEPTAADVAADNAIYAAQKLAALENRWAAENIAADRRAELAAGIG